MLSVTVFHPPLVRGNRLLVRVLSELPSHVLFDTFPQANVSVIKYVAEKINPSGGHRENLMILFYVQF